MFTQSTEPINEPKPVKSKPIPHMYQSDNTFVLNEQTSQNIDSILEKEKQSNKADNWNKLDKTAKIQKLHAFAEKFGKENGYPVKDIKSLKFFFVDCLEKNKLQKSKDLVYDKESGNISSIPSLHFNSESRNFTLRITDSKRVSTLKSLTPKRIVNEVKASEITQELI
jgi:hypothetical protein